MKNGLNSTEQLNYINVYKKRLNYFSLNEASLPGMLRYQKERKKEE